MEDGVEIKLWHCNIIMIKLMIDNTVMFDAIYAV